MQFVQFVRWSLILASFPSVALAQLEWGQEYGSRVRSRETLAALGPGSFGEQLNLFDGSTSFSAADVSIPGNDALPVGITRKLSVGAVNNAAMEAPFGDWELVVPYLSNVSVTSSGWQAPPDPSFFWTVGGTDRFARCSSPQVPGDANTVDIPNMLVNAPGGGELFLLTPATSSKLARPTIPGVRWLTKGFWYFGCTPTLASGHSGEGFWAVDPSGTRYTFDWMVRHAYPGFSTPAIQSGAQLVHNRSELRLYPTRVEDRFGNSVTYRWQGRRLMSIVASDGRRIDLAYGVDDQITSVSAHGKTWTYTYRDFASPGVGGQLLSVTNPDGSRWEYGNNPGPFVQYAPRYEQRTTSRGGRPVIEWVEVFEKVTFCSYDHYLSTAVVPFNITHPSGARAEFRFKTMRHGRTNVPGACEFSWDSNDGASRESQNSHNLYPAFKDVWSLVGKSIEGPGVSRLDWSYSYDDLQACITTTCALTGAPNRKRVTTTQPNGDTVVDTFGKRYGEDEGLLLSSETRRGATIASRVDHVYVSAAEAETAPFPAKVGESGTDFSDPFSSSALRPLKQTTRVEDGTTFVMAVNAFDVFARPVNVAKWNSAGFGKTDLTEYVVDPVRWVTGLVRRQTNAETGIVVSETEYDDRLLPVREFEHGRLKRSYTSWPDGTVRTSSDPLGNVTTLSDYFRGIPRRLVTPPTAEAPTGSLELVTVSELGWITSITDEMGAKTCYDYDPMGRLARVTHPSVTQPGVCDTSGWDPTVAVFEQVLSSERGLEAGHWRRTRTEGSRRKSVTHFDALWRPVFEESWDDADVAGTQTQVVTSYDFRGRVTFQTLPLRGLSAVGQATQGVRTFYDALGRRTRLEQDSELGVLAQTVEYLPGLQTRTVNPRGFASVATHQGWESLQEELVIRLEQPEGKVVEITRHPRFGWPLSLTQRDAASTLSVTRSYVYDGPSLCKMIEPEGGVTVYGRDAADDPVWIATGLTGPAFESTSSCSTVEAAASGRVVNRAFDARHRLTHVRFPDGRGDEVRTYEPNGLLSSVTAFNGPGNSTPVITSYTYDRRRFVTSETSRQPGWYSWTLASAYDRLGNLSSLQYPSGLTLDFAPNALGQPTQVRDQSGRTYVSSAARHPNGTLSQFVFGNGLAYSMAQNGRQLPLEVRTGTVQATRFEFDAMGNVTAMSDLTIPASPRSRTMTYDALDRLTSATSPSFGGSDGRHTMAYDALDNLRSWRLAGVKDDSFVYDPRNRLVEARSGSSIRRLTYDVQGNVTAKDTLAFDFDMANRLREVVGREAYRYDGHGRRVLSWEPASGTATLFAYDQEGTLRVEQRDDVLTERITFDRSLVAERTTVLSTGASAVRYVHTDLLGSPVVVTDQSGAVVDRNDYEPFGAVVAEPFFSGPGFGGHVVDRTAGLSYMQQRYYDPSLGRFLSVDPQGALGRAEPASAFQAATLNVNRYWYANANPYRFVDPDGRAADESMIRANTEAVLVMADPSVSKQERTHLLDVMEGFVKKEIADAPRLKKLGVIMSLVIEPVDQKDSKGAVVAIRFTTRDFAKLTQLANRLAQTNPKAAARLRQIIEKGRKEGRIIVRDDRKKR